MLSLMQMSDALQALILVGFSREEVDIFKHMMNDMDADMVKVCGPDPQKARPLRHVPSPLLFLFSKLAHAWVPAMAHLQRPDRTEHSPTAR